MAFQLARCREYSAQLLSTVDGVSASQVQRVQCTDIEYRYHSVDGVSVSLPVGSSAVQSL
jgi:hypothetical protein